MSSLILTSPERFQGQSRRAFTVTEKINVLECLSNDSNTLSNVARQYDIDRSLVYRWKQQKDDLLSANDQRSAARRVSGAGRPSSISNEVKTGLLSFVDERRATNLPVTPRMIYHEWLRIDPTIACLTEHCVRQRIHRFMKRYDLVVRRTTHQAQRTRNNPKIISDWIEYIQEAQDSYGISNDCIVNFDETDVQFAMNTNTTIAYRGQRTVAVRNPVSSSRCTVMLGVAADGYKFPPYVIFKGKRAARIAQEIRKWDENGYSDGCVYGVQEKAWMNESMMLDWIQKVWKPFTASKGGELTMMIIDQFAVHLMPSVKKAIEDCGTIVEFIPKGYTSCLQVCDIGLNKPFKDYMRAAVNEWMVVNNAEERPQRPTVSHWIDHAWKRISHSTIINTWAHIKLADRITSNEEAVVINKDDTLNPGHFMDNDDAREDDILELRESDEMSTDEEDLI